MHIPCSAATSLFSTRLRLISLAPALAWGLAGRQAATHPPTGARVQKAARALPHTHTHTHTQNLASFFLFLFLFLSNAKRIATLCGLARLFRPKHSSLLKAGQPISWPSPSALRCVALHCITLHCVLSFFFFCVVVERRAGRALDGRPHPRAFAFSFLFFFFPFHSSLTGQLFLALQ